ncbi:hypothetical protein I3843_02G019300 [Carya illinoinensis]|nr:hypothetical protein I3843_02G019300 [Carya illinoinensis]
MPTPPPHRRSLSLVLLHFFKNASLSTFLFLDQIVWLGRTGIYKNKELTDPSGRISLYCSMGSSICSTLIGERGRLSVSIKKSLALIKASMDIVVAVGLLQLAPKKVSPRVTGAFGFVSSLISCYQLLPSLAKSKAP